MTGRQSWEDCDRRHREAPVSMDEYMKVTDALGLPMVPRWQLAQRLSSGERCVVRLIVESD
jgi:hypothetical protein